MSVKGVIGFRGMKPSGNELNHPPGSLLEALNCVIPSKDVLMPRRGHKLQTSAAGAPIYFDDDPGDSEGYRARELHQWLTHLLISSFHTDSGGYKLLARADFLTADEAGYNYGNFVPPEPALLRMKFAELAQSVYFTTSDGLCAIGAVAVGPRAAGVPPPRGAVSGPEDTSTGMLANGGCKLSGNPNASGSWLPANAAVAARACIGIKDENDIPHLSAPCGRTVVKNPADLVIAIGGVVRFGNVVTVTLAAGQTHSYRFGDIVNLTLTGGDVGNFNTTNNVITGVTATTFSWAQTAANYTNVAAVTVTSGTKAVQWVFAIPSGLTADVHFFQVYRTDETVGATIDPGDECFQVYERYLTSTDITNGYVTVTDNTPSSLALGPPLPTNENTGDGVDAGANDRPPLLRDICEWDSRLWGAQAVDRHVMTLRLLGVGSPAGMQSGDLVAINDQVYVGGTHQSVSTAGLPTENMRRCAESLVSYSHIFRGPSGQTLHLAENPTLGLPELLITSDSLTGGKFYAGCSRATVFQEALPSVINVTEASTSRLANVVTVTTTIAHGLASGSSVMLARSGSADANFPTGLKGPITVTGATTFTYAETGANATMGGTFYVYAASFGSTQDKKPLRFSKQGQPEAWPSAFYTGGLPDGAEVLRVKPLPSGMGLLVCLKVGGFYTVTGSYPYVVRPLDRSAVLIAPDTLQEHAGALYALTSQGECTISEAGVGILSGDVDELVRMLIARLTDGSVGLGIPFGVSYESEQQYHLFAPLENVLHPGNVTTTVYQDLVLKSLTGQFTRWVCKRTCGLVWAGADVLVMGDADTNRLRVERKTLGYGGLDFADEQIGITGTFTQHDPTTMRYTVATSTGGLANVSAGDAIELPAGSGTFYRVTGTDQSSYVDFAAVLADDNDAATLYVSYVVEGTWIGDSRGTPGVESRWRQLQLHFKERLFDTLTLTFQGEKSDTTGTTVVRGQADGTAFAFAQPVSRLSNLRGKVPDNFERAAMLTMSFSMREAFSYFKLLGYSGAGDQVTERTGQ